MKSSFFVWSTVLLRWFFEDKYLMHPIFPNLLSLLSKNLFSKFHPQSAHSPERFLATFSCQIWWTCAWSFGEDGWYSTIVSKEYYWLFECFSISSFVCRFPICQRSLGHFADSNSIPWSLTTSFLSGHYCSHIADAPSFARRVLFQRSMGC